MRYFLNPISVSDEDRAFIFFLNATIVFVVFIILLAITVHIVKKNKNVENESGERKKHKDLVSLIIADCLILFFVIVVLNIIG